jgi:hypothetical protein
MLKALILALEVILSWTIVSVGCAAVFAYFLGSQKIRFSTGHEELAPVMPMRNFRDFRVFPEVQHASSAVACGVVRS